jgi:hypothetical protein
MITAFLSRYQSCLLTEAAGERLISKASSVRKPVSMSRKVGRSWYVQSSSELEAS